MPLNPAKVGLAVQGGLSVVCATCKLYWEARDRGVPEPQCLAKDGCGSPLRGDDFHEYQGPITEFSRWCFVCGDESKFGVLVNGKKKTLGACERHIKLVSELKPLHMEAPTVSVLKPDGWVSADRLRQPQRKTLAQAIFEVENYYASKEGK